MFVKIRKKFICVSIFSVFLVLLIILGTINIINYTRIVNDADMIVYVLKENNGELRKDSGRIYLLRYLFPRGILPLR